MPSPTTYLKTPLVYTKNPRAFHDVFELGKKQTVRLCEIGDSQATTPEGLGEPWNFGVNKALAEFYGNSPETALNTGGNFGGFGSAHSVQGKWGMAGRDAISPAESTTPVGEVLPATTIQALDTSANYQSGQLGIFLMNNISATTPQYRNSNYFSYSNGVRLKYYAFTRTSAGLMTIGSAYNATNAQSFTLADFQTSINFGQDNSTLAVVSGVSNLMTAPTSTQYLQIGFKLTSGTNPLELYAARFQMEGFAFGAVMDSFGFGGYAANQWLAAYSGTGKALKGTGPYNCALISFGANDMSSRSQAQYKKDILDVINYVRAAMGDNYFPVIVTTDYQRLITLPADRVRYESYPIAAWELANEQINVMAVNLQRLTYMMGWTAAEMDFTGLTARGAYSTASVAYVVNNYVTIDAFPGATGTTNRGTMYYKCIANHTSSVSNGPVNSQFWVPICRLSWQGDGVNCNFYAGEPIAKATVSLILQEAYRDTCPGTDDFGRGRLSVGAN